MYLMQIEFQVAHPEDSARTSNTLYRVMSGLEVHRELVHSNLKDQCMILQDKQG